MTDIIKCNLESGKTSEKDVLKALSKAINQYLIEKNNGAFFSVFSEAYDTFEHFHYQLRLFLALPDEIKIQINLPESSEVFKTIQNLLSTGVGKTIATSQESQAQSTTYTLPEGKTTLRDKIEAQLTSMFPANTVTVRVETSAAALAEQIEINKAIFQKILSEIGEKLSLEDKEFIDYCRYYYFSKLANYYSLTSQYEMAIKCYDEAIQICDPYIEKPLWKAIQLTTKQERAQIWDSQGKSAEALQAYRQISEEIKKLYGNDSIILLKSEISILDCRSSQGDKDLAEEYASLSAKAVQWYGRTHVVTAGLWNSQASFLAIYASNAEEQQTAIELYKKALKVFEDNNDCENLHYASTLNNLAAAHANNKNYDLALPLYEKALDIYKKTNGEFHSSVANVLNNIATVLIDQKKYDEALPLYKQALDILQRTFGKNHHKIASTINNIASLYSRQHQYDVALKLYEKSRSISETALGVDHPNVASTLNNMGALFCSQGKYDKATEHLLRALAIRKTKLGDDHPHTRITQRWLDIVRDNAAAQPNSATAALAITSPVLTNNNAGGPSTAPAALVVSPPTANTVNIANNNNGNLSNNSSSSSSSSSSSKKRPGDDDQNLDGGSPLQKFKTG